MKVANVTVMATIHGLWEGFQLGCARRWRRGQRLCSDAHFRFHRHAGTQPVETGLISFEADSYWNALHHFNVISRRVLGRQNAGDRSRRPANTFDVTLEILLQTHPRVFWSLAPV